MQFLAIEREEENVDWEQLGALLKEEARHVYNWYLSGSLRQIYFTEHKHAVLILEARDAEDAMQMLAALPLVKEGKIRFEVMELRPYTGYERIMEV